MQRLNFEKQFSRKLKDRELTPSEGSWEKLQGRLEIRKNKNTAGFLWMGIAASLIAAFVLFNFMGAKPNMDSPAIADTPGSGVEKSPEEKISVIDMAAEEPEADLDTVPVRRGVALPQLSEETSVVESSKITTGIMEDKSNPKVNQYKSPEIHGESGSEVQTGITAVESAGEAEISDTEINSLLEKAMAEVFEEQGGGLQVTDAEIEALLAEARASVRPEQALYQTATMSADQLLTEVESELEHSFRAQVFEIIKDGLRKTRNAVADINQ